MRLTDSVLNDLFNYQKHNSSFTRESKNIRYSFSSTDSTQIISLAVPGFQKSEIFMNTSPSSYSCNTLNISSNIDDQRLDSNPLLFNFNTKFRISKEYDTDGIKANMQDGILTITLPKREVVDVRRTIQID